MNTQKPKTKIKMGEREEVQRDKSHELPDWLQEFRENLVDTEPWVNTRAGKSRHFQVIS